ncbi:hypothetical protein ABW19_dt0208349 [Dactylella cylindrospora]|nr:hypothetical protein ABW19_dt0208349 [Dactylella cylindrospora]
MFLTRGAKKKLKAVRRAIRNAEAVSLTSVGNSSPHISAGITKRFRAGSVAKSATSSLQQHLSPTKGNVGRDGLQKSATDPTSNTSGPGSGGLGPTPGSGGLAPTPGSGRLGPPPSSGSSGRRKSRERDLLSIGEDQDEDEFDRRKSVLRRGAVTDTEAGGTGRRGDGDEGERQHLNPSPGPGLLAPPSGGYGSISPSTTVRPASTVGVPPRPTLPPVLDLPEPARPLEDTGSPILQRARTYDSSYSGRSGVLRGERTPRFALFTGGPSAQDGLPQTVFPGEDFGLKPPSSVGQQSGHPIFRNVFSSIRHRISPGRRPSDPNLRNAQVYLEMTEDAQKEFFSFLAAELKKIDEFYELKEQEAKDRLVRIEHQISIMTKNRLQEKERERLAAAEEPPAPVFDWKHPKDMVTGTVMHVKKKMSLDRNGDPKSPPSDKFRPTIAKLGTAAVNAAVGPAQPNHQKNTTSSFDDYTRRTETQHVRYKTAKRKIKAALVEYYHSLELLKSYSLLNREGFRKILKKFDKAAHTRISNKYLEEKINTASFASSDEVDQLISKTEDIYATHYEKGRRKHAVERLRTRDHKRPATAAMFRSGVYLGMALPLIVQGLYEAYQRLQDGFGMKHESEVSYLLQIWAGFAFPTLFMLLFALCCRAWVEARINYVFIFEFDTRNNIDWRELLELPSLFIFIEALLMWFSFVEFWGDDFDRIWFPLVYVGFLIMVLFNPFKIGYYHSRKWLLYTLYRLMWAGYYPVEFRDFWSGDIFCSMTYTLGNIPLFFCLWSRKWDSPNQCNSSNSRLLGFFTTVPSIWRLLQCFRRYSDTKNAFPHLANGAKYGCGILYYMMLSLWRMDKGNEKIKAAFILFAAFNAVYTSTWDLLMDWSLLNWYAPNRLLRTELAFRRPIVYYLAMIIDPAIRFSWIFYLIFANNVQHSALLSFLLSLAELLRRFVWCFFRMENEHCTNVNKFRAYKDDVPLPYDIPCPSLPSRVTSGILTTTPTGISPDHHLRMTGAEARADEEIATATTPIIPPSRGTPQPPPSGTGRPRADSRVDRTPLLRAYTIATAAHAQDFERKRPPTAGSAIAGGTSAGLRRVLTGTAVEDDDDDDDDSDEDEARAAEDMAGVSLADDAVEGMAGLRRRRGSYQPSPMNGGGVGDGIMYRATGAVLSPRASPQLGAGGHSPGEGTSSGYRARDYARRS